MARQTTLADTRIQLLEEHLAHLEAIIEQQESRIGRQQAEITDLRERADTKGQRPAPNRGRGHRAGRISSRRALLKWGGAAAAAAAVTLVASEQSAQAAGKTDGFALVLGITQGAEHQTQIQYDGAAGNAAVILLANDSTFSGSAANFPAALGGWIGNGTTTGGRSGNTNGVYGYTEATGGFGVVGMENSGSTTGAGVRGIGGTNGKGVWGTSNGGVSNGVFGDTDIGHGVLGSATSTGTGVWGQSNNGTAISAQSNNGVDIAAVGTGRILQNSYGGVGAPSSGTHYQHESVRDTLGDLYLCVAGGSPGAWKKVAAIPAGTLGGATIFLHAPFRLFDTRPGVSGCPIDPGVPMASGAVTTLQVTGTASTTDATLVVPSGATGIIGDLLAINVNGNGITGGFAGFLTLQPHSGSPTGNSYLHYYPATVQHNCVVMGLDASGKLDVGNYNTATNVGLDITGYII